jgi:rhodanese-related sulfurtransferase
MAASVPPGADDTRAPQSIWPASLQEAGILLIVALLAAGAWWARSPERLPLRADPAVYELELAAPLVDAAEARVFYDEGVHLFIDTRAQRTGETIPGSLLIREATFDDDLLAHFDFMLPEDPLILFGDGDLSRTSNVAGRLQQRGFENLHILAGGLSAWKKAGGETSTANLEAGP